MFANTNVQTQFYSLNLVFTNFYGLKEKDKGKYRKIEGTGNQEKRGGKKQKQKTLK